MHLLQARDWAERVFRTCGVGVGGAFVTRCVCVWATARRSPTNVRRAFSFRKLFAGCCVFVAKAKFAPLRALLMTRHVSAVGNPAECLLGSWQPLHRVIECCGCRLVDPGCPVEDDVCLDALVSWLPGRSLFFFHVGVYYTFFPLTNWAITPY